MIKFEGLTLFLLVFTRLAAMFFFNPLLARRNFPTQARTALVVSISFLLSSVIDTVVDVKLNSLSFVFMLMQEIFIGFVLGFVFSIFYYMLVFAGDVLDTDFGMAMAKVFDPGTNIQLSLTGKLLTIIFAAYIFATDSHLALISLFAYSFDALPVGTLIIQPQILEFLIQLFTQVFLLAIRLILPFAVSEFCLQIIMGVLMKLVPQIHVFVINFQLKQGLGLVLMFVLAPIISSFVDNYVTIILENTQRAITLLAH